MANSTLKKTHPQKYLLKYLCQYLYYTGAGVCWYEKPEMSPVQKKIYTVWCVISNVYIFGGMLNQFLSYLRSDLSEKEKLNLLQFTFGNIAVTVKILVFYLQKDRIIVLFEGFLERYREFSSIELEKASVKKALRYCAIPVILGFITVILTLVESVVLHFIEGEPIQTEITYFPSSTTPSLLFNLSRCVIEIHWYFIGGITLSVDVICIVSLVFLGFKFKRLQTYFEQLRIPFLENIALNNTSSSDLEKEFERGFINGIKLHKDALWCARNVQYALGNLYSIQIIESIVLIVMCLLKTIETRDNFASLVTNLCYLIVMVILTGSYMLAGGDVTNEAALVPTSIFHSGWELNRARKNLRTLAVVAMVNSQVPVLMTAFGIISLSYRNFLMILRHSYSFFAVMY